VRYSVSPSPHLTSILGVYNSSAPSGACLTRVAPRSAPRGAVRCGRESVKSWMGGKRDLSRTAPPLAGSRDPSDRAAGQVYGHKCLSPRTQAASSAASAAHRGNAVLHLLTQHTARRAGQNAVRQKPRSRCSEALPPAQSLVVFLCRALPPAAHRDAARARRHPPPCRAARASKAAEPG
ncbi:Glycosyl hydrolase family 109 protein 5, partial [Frankliniella fusca]